MTLIGLDLNASRAPHDYHAKITGELCPFCRYVYSERLKHVVKVPGCPAGHTSVWAQYTVRFPNDRERDTAAAQLKQAGVPTAVYYTKGLHHQTAYRDYPVAGNGLPASDRLTGKVLSLPMHPYLDEGTQDHIAAALRTALGGAAAERHRPETDASDPVVK